MSEEILTNLLCLLGSAIALFIMLSSNDDNLFNGLMICIIIINMLFLLASLFYEIYLEDQNKDIITYNVVSEKESLSFDANKIYDEMAITLLHDMSICMKDDDDKELWSIDYSDLNPKDFSNVLCDLDYSMYQNNAMKIFITNIVISGERTKSNRFEEIIGYYGMKKSNGHLLVYFIPIEDIKKGTKKEYNEKYRLLTIWIYLKKTN